MLNLHKAHAEYILWLKKHHSILRQKARIKWAADGDTKSKYFYSVIKEKRRRTHIFRIKNKDIRWIEGNDNIAQAAIDHFNNLFTYSTSDNDLSIINCIEPLISIDPDSSRGPDGYNGHFYQASWDIIKEDVCNFVQGFFSGSNLSKFITHTNLVLIPKVTSPNTLDQLCPISMINVSNKIISKILATRLGVILPKLISDNQSGFIKRKTHHKKYSSCSRDCTCYQESQSRRQHCHQDGHV